MSKITTCLWYDSDAEEAARLYTSLVPNSAITRVSRAPSDFPNGKAGDVLMVEFTLDGAQFLGLNGHSKQEFGLAASIIVACDDQAEVDRLWAALTADGGRESQCGWLYDRFGVPWQITPRRLTELVSGPDREASRRAFEAMMPMKKIDIATIEAAAAG
ncbi:MAG: VOC family protein [Armatimonadetes bacterium]|nr:VOC family protein [Armatimonadota bacterium]